MPKWFFVENGFDKKRDLVKEGIVFTDLSIAFPKNAVGISFPESEKEKVIEILGLTGHELTESPTDKTGVFILESWQPKVVVENDSNMENLFLFKPVIEKYAKLLSLDIYASNPHGRPRDAKKEPRKLFLYFWSAPRYNEIKISSVFGIVLEDGQKDACEPSGHGYVIRDEKETAVAEIVEGTLYILFDLPHGPNAAELLEKIMEVYLNLIIDPKEMEKLNRENVKRNLEITKNAYVVECSKRLKNETDKARQAIETAEANITKYQIALVEAIRNEKENRQKISDLERFKNEKEKEFAKEFSNLLKIPGVEKVEVRSGLIEVYTSQIDVDYKEEIYNIGKFRIDIYTSGSGGGVRCYNLTRKVTDESNVYFHPHIKASGVCCLGNLSDGVAKLIAEYQYSVLAQIMIRYLQSVNSSDWYYNIERWPKKKGEEKDGKKTGRGK